MSDIQFRTDQFNAERHKEANAYTVQQGTAIGAGIAGAAEQYQQNQQQSARIELAREQMRQDRTAHIANLALRHRDMELSMHAQAFEAMQRGQELARRSEEAQAEISLKQAQQAEYMARMGEIQQRKNLNLEVAIAQEQVKAAKLQNDAMEFQLKQQKLAMDSARADTGAAKQHADMMSSIYKNLIDDANIDRQGGPPKDLEESLGHLRRIATHLAGGSPKLSSDAEGTAKKLLGNDLPAGVDGADADVEAVMQLLSGSTVISELAEKEPHALPQIAAGVAKNMPRVLKAANGDREIASEWMRTMLYRAGSWQRFLTELDKWGSKK